MSNVNGIDLASCVREHGDFLFSYARRRVDSMSQAEDLVQDTFLSALHSLSSFRGDSSPRTWLVSILRNKIIDFYRRRSAARAVSLDSIDESSLLEQLFDSKGHWTKEAAPCAWQNDPETQLGQKEFLSEVQNCLEKLPPKMRRIFVFRELDELSRDVIANSLGVTANNIGVLLHRARLLLRDCVNGKGKKGTRND